MIGKSGPHLGVADGQWYRLITSAFLPPTGSSGLMDIAFNMLALIFVGPALERLLGHLRFASVYLLSALGGSVFFYLIAPPTEAALGASGAIFGLFGAWFVVSRRLRADTRAIVFLIALNLAFSLVFRSSIAWQAHVGGLIVGSLITAAYAYAPRNQRALVQGGATIVILAVLVIAVLMQELPRLASARQALGLTLLTQRHLVERITPPMMKAKPTTRFQSPNALTGRLPCVT